VGRLATKQRNVLDVERGVKAEMNKKEEYDQNIVFTCLKCGSHFLQPMTTDLAFDKMISHEEAAALILRGAEKISRVHCDTCQAREIADNIDDDILKILRRAADELEEKRFREKNPKMPKVRPDFHKAPRKRFVSKQRGDFGDHAAR